MGCPWILLGEQKKHKVRKNLENLVREESSTAKVTLVTTTGFNPCLLFLHLGKSWVMPGDKI